jgi:hypothetical protein
MGGFSNRLEIDKFYECRGEVWNQDRSKPQTDRSLDLTAALRVLGTGPGVLNHQVRAYGMYSLLYQIHLIF